MKETCNQAFEAGYQARREYPLREGAFKLKDGRYSHRSLLTEIQTIAAFKRKEFN